MPRENNNLEVKTFYVYQGHIDFLIKEKEITGLFAAEEVRRLIKEYVESNPRWEKFKKEQGL